MDITTVCESIAAACDSWNLGYSQPDRLAIYPGGSCDCSSLAAWAYNQGGANFPGDTSTHNMRARAAAQGFEVIPWTPKTPLAAGDAVLSEAASGGVGHVAVYTGGDTLREAWISETGDIDGAPGDQTGSETRTVSYSGHPYTAAGRWTHILRPPSTTTTPTHESTEGETMRFVRSVQTGTIYAVTPLDVSAVKSAALWGFLTRAYDVPAYEDLHDGEIGMLVADAAARRARILGDLKPAESVPADVDEEALAKSLASLIPDTLATQVADILAERLAS